VQITVTGRNLDITPAMQEYVEKRVRKLKKYFSSIVDVHVVLFLQRFQHLCEITMNASGITLHGHDRTEDLYASVDRVVEKLERQLKKHKGKLQSHRTKFTTNDKNLQLQVDLLDGEDIEAATEQPQIIYTREVELKPMSVDEAATQMDLFNQEFLMFRNMKTDRVNVLHRRKDGNYCLIDPKT